MSEKKNFKSGFVAIIGKPNVGKSSLMNLFLGQKLSIVTNKPQTTRKNILGILTRNDFQIIFIDTPGFLKPRYLLQEKMQKSIIHSLKDADIVIFISDINSFPTDYDNATCKILKKMKITKFGVINKIDLGKKDEIKKVEKKISEFDFDKLFFISVKENFGISQLVNEIKNFLPTHPAHFPKDDISTQPIRFFTEEIILEKIFLLLKKELPYTSAVTIEKFIEVENSAEIYANIFVESSSQKKIIIGNNGQMIKKIRQLAEKDIHKIVGKRIKLNLWIKVRKNWRKKERILKELGYS